MSDSPKINVGSCPFSLSQVGIPPPGTLLIPRFFAGGVRDRSEGVHGPDHHPDLPVRSGVLGRGTSGGTPGRV